MTPTQINAVLAEFGWLFAERNIFHSKSGSTRVVISGRYVYIDVKHTENVWASVSHCHVDQVHKNKSGFLQIGRYAIKPLGDKPAPV